MMPNFSAAGLNARLVTGLVLAAVLVTVWNAGGWPLFLLLAVVIGLALWEFYSLMMSWEDKSVKIAGVALGVGYVTLAWLAPDYPPHLGFAALAFILALSCLFRWTRENSARKFMRAAILLAGLAYVPLLLTPTLRFTPGEQLLIVAVPALSDVTAYFAGVAFGKHRIWPGVSPKKSVEGSAAGLGAAMLTAVGVGLVWGAAPAWNFALLGLVLGVMGQLGDFFESALKRSVDIKDSGNILPGHGGALDRIDSILFACGTYAIISSCRPFFI